ncbi:MAG: alpha/beta hydrolase, partial [Acidimicrobiales bacterium]
MESEGDGAEISPAAARFRAFAESTGADRRALAACARGAFRERVALERNTVRTLVVAGERDDLARRPE